MKNKILNKSGFTLAEVLTTLMVIGIVAALTIPNLMNSYKKHTYYVGAKKAQSYFQNWLKLQTTNAGCFAGDYVCANLLSPGDDSSLSTWKFPNFRMNFENTIFPSKKIGISDINKKYYYITNSKKEEYTSINTLYITADGMAWSFNHLAPMCPNWKKPCDSRNGFLNILADTNGPYKGPNIIGYDVHCFRLFSRKIPDGPEVGVLYPCGSQDSGTPWDHLYKCDSKNISVTCTGRMMEKGKIDY